MHNIKRLFIIAITMNMLFISNAIASEPVKNSIFSYYWQDGAGDIVRTGSGGCLHTRLWKTGMSDCPAAAVPVVLQKLPTDYKSCHRKN